LKKAVRSGYSIAAVSGIFDLSHEADDAHLVREMANNKEHCIHQLLPPAKMLHMKHRQFHCLFALIRCHFNLYKRSSVKVKKV